MNAATCRWICCLSLLLVTSAPLFADPSPSLYLKIKLRLKNGITTSGYLYTLNDNARLYIAKDDRGYSYHSKTTSMRIRTTGNVQTGVYVAETDYHFHRHAHQYLYDTIYLFDQLKIINLNDDPMGEPDVVGAMFGSSQIILRKEIEDLTVERFFICSYGRVRTQLSAGDTLWMKNELKQKRLDAGGTELCNFQALTFTPTNQMILALLEELRTIGKGISVDVDTNTYNTIEAKVNAIVEKLRQEKVIVIEWCSC